MGREGTSGTLASAGSGAASALDDRVARAAAAVRADGLAAARLVSAVPVAPAAQADALAARLLARVVAAHVVVGGHAVHGALRAEVVRRATQAIGQLEHRHASRRSSRVRATNRRMQRLCELARRIDAIHCRRRHAQQVLCDQLRLKCRRAYVYTHNGRRRDHSSRFVG